MSRLLAEPPIDAARGYFSQLCVMLTGIASGVVAPTDDEAGLSAAYQMGQRDGFHVVVSHLASSQSLREAAEKCRAFGRGVRERAEAHPYGPDWCAGFARATTDAAGDLAMYAATATLPVVDRQRLRSARTAARNLSPLGDGWPRAPHENATPRDGSAPRGEHGHREW